jgi:excisionase family DNA binding protein
MSDTKAFAGQPPVPDTDSRPVDLAAVPLSERLLWSTKDLAAMTGWSERTIKRFIAADVLPGVIRAGRTVRIARRAVEDWIHDGAPRLRMFGS